MSTLMSSKSLSDLGESQSSARSSASGPTSYSSSRLTHNRRLADLKKKKHQQAANKTPFKKGSLSNLSGSLRAKLNGANGVLSRLISSTTSLPLASTGSDGCSSPVTQSQQSSKHNSISSTSQLDLAPPESTFSNGHHYDLNPLYDVIHEEGDYAEQRSRTLPNGHGHGTLAERPTRRSSHQFSDNESVGGTTQPDEVASVFTDTEDGLLPKDYELDRLSTDIPYETDASVEAAREERRENDRLVLYFLVK